MKKIAPTSELFTRNVASIVPNNALAALLSTGRQLRIKHGIDATSSSLHIGHAANLWKLRLLQEIGHKAVILFGDATTQIGDPTGKSKTRPILPLSEIEKNIHSLQRQAETILLTDEKRYEVRRNSEWFGATQSIDFLKILSLVTHARLIERDMFQERIKKGNEITLSELVYPILQGYDSVMLKSDLTVIGSDQLFNEQMGRFLQEKFKQSPQVIVCLAILPGLDGIEKMSKSTGNCIRLDDSPAEKFGKIMRLSDALILPYLEAYTHTPLGKIERWKEELHRGKNPMEAKLFLAEKLVEIYHGISTAKKERNNFIKLFSQKINLEDLPALKIKTGAWNAVEFLVATKLSASKSEARRLIQQKSVDINGKTLNDISEKIDIVSGATIRVGKHKFFRII